MVLVCWLFGGMVWKNILKFEWFSFLFVVEGLIKGRFLIWRVFVMIIVFVELDGLIIIVIGCIVWFVFFLVFLNILYLLLLVRNEYVR